MFIVYSIVLQTQTGCMGDISASLRSLQNMSASKVSFNSDLPAVNASNVSHYTVSGTCSVDDTYTLMGTDANGAQTKLKDFSCTKGIFSFNQDMTPVVDGNLALSVVSSATSSTSLLSPSTTPASVSGEISIEKDTVIPIGSLLTPPPAVNSLTTIASGVSTSDTVSYSFKIGVVGVVDCAFDSGYSAYIPVQTPINENIAMIPDGPVSLCLRAQDEAGNKQVSATVYSWTKDTSIPTAVLTGLPTTDTNIAAQVGTVGGAGVISYSYKFGLSAAVDCTSSSGYGGETPVASAINVTTASGNGSYKLCVRGKNAIGTWQPLASATSVSWNYDTTAPVLTITSPTAGAYINNANQSAFSVTISCSENGRSVSVTATSSVDSSQTSSSGTCNAGTVTLTLDLSARPEGAITLSATQTDIAGNAGSATTVSIVKDTVAPVLLGVVADGTYGTSLTTSPNLSWSAATDTGGSGIQKYQIAIGTTAGGTQVLNWTDVGNVTSYQISGLSLTDGTTYYPQVRAVDFAGQTSSAISGDGWIVDATAPDVSGVTLTLASDSWSTTTTPQLSWNAAVESGSGLANYEIAIGSGAGLADVMTWTAAGTVTSTSFSGLTLTRGSTYYASLRAKDTAGNVSSVVNGANTWIVSQELWTTNGEVKAMIKSGSTLYIGGNFSRVSAWQGGGVPLNATDGSLAWPNALNRARVSGTVATSVADGSGGFYIGGNFAKVGGLTRNNIAHILADGTVDANFNVNVNSAVQALVLSGTTLYLGGYFSTVAGVARTRVAAVSTVDGSIVTTFNPTVNAGVNALLLSGTTLYLGGMFTTVNGTTRNRAAAVLTTDGSLVAGFNPNVNSTVNALAISGSTLYMGGMFWTVGASGRTYLAAVSATTGAVVAGFNPTVSGTVLSLAVSGSNIYFGGIFSTVNGTTRYSIAAVDLVNATLVAGFNPNAGAWNTVNSLVASGTTLYMAGSFKSIGGTSIKSIAAVSLTDGSLISGFNADANVNITSLCLSGTTLYAGGASLTFGGVTRNNLAALSMDGTVLAGFNPNVSAPVNGGVFSMALANSTLYVGGYFTTVGGVLRDNIAAVSTVDGSLFTGFNPGTDSYVYSMQLGASTLYLGGGFNTVAGATRNYVAAVSTGNGSIIAGFDPNADSSVYSLVLSGSTLYMGGDFRNLGGTVRNRIAAVSTVDGSVIAGFDPNADYYINSMALSGSTLYIGGAFGTMGGLTRNNMAAVSITDGSVIAGFDPNPAGEVYTLATDGTTVYIGGNFSTVGGTPKNGIAAISASNGSLIPAFAPNSISASVTTLVLSNSTLFTGGTFTQIGDGSGYLAPLRSDTGDWLPGF